MNAETVALNMTPKEADSVVFVLMTALRKVSMLDRERTDATAAANALLSKLGYRHTTSAHGHRIESSE